MSGMEADGSRPERQTSGRLWNRIYWSLAGVAVIAVSLVIRYYWSAPQANAQAPVQQRSTPVAAPQADPPTAAPAQSNKQVAATVNDRRITRQQLADACVQRFGKDVLESLVNKYLIAHELQRNNLAISDQEIRAEIDRLAKKFRLSVQQYLQLLERERNIKPEQYARDIIWPTLALRKLASDRLTVSPQELQQAKDSLYGPAVMARVIMLGDIQTAERIHAQLRTSPQDFAKLAREHSTDAPSASSGGRLQPIRRHMGDKQIEDVVFSLDEGQISPVVRIADQFGIFLAEKKIPARPVKLAEVEQQLRDRIIDGKLRSAASDLFEQLQKTAVVVNVYNDPARRQQMPGVAATINGQPIPMVELAEECLARHGEQVLENEINHVLVEQELARRGVQITQADLHEEIARAAQLANVVDENKQPDVQAWIKTITEEQGLSYDVYIRDLIWPTASLKKLVAGAVQVSEEDLEKGMEANYGPRVRCRAILISNLRRAQEVWNKARQNPTVEYFAKLAEEYSEETSSGSLGGQVPPLQKHGGQPILEREAFKLEQGELSGVIQVGEHFVILFCEGYTEPVKVEMQEVRDLLEQDIYEKKVRVAMAKRFDQLRQSATIDNFLTGKTQAPETKKPSPAGAAGATSLRPVEGISPQ